MSGNRGEVISACSMVGTPRMTVAPSAAISRSTSSASNSRSSTTVAPMSRNGFMWSQFPTWNGGK